MAELTLLDFIRPFVIVIQLVSFRVLFSALVMSVLIELTAAVRKRLTPALRSLCWAACFLGLLLPYERSSILLLSERLQQSVTAGFTAAAFENIASDTLGIVIGAGIFLYSFIWFAGFLFFAANMLVELRKTRHMLKNGKYHICAAYFYRWRSRIYLPPDFETAYTAEEQEMLLSHENQHIVQHDPFWYYLLVIVICIFWFCPPVHKAVRLFKQDRELLCDERVTQRYSQYDYGMLLLKAARGKTFGLAIPGIVSETLGIDERIEAFVKPLVIDKRAVSIIVCVTIILTAAGLRGFAPITESKFESYGYKQIIVSLEREEPLTQKTLTNEYIHDFYITAMEKFITIGEEHLVFDAKGMYDYAISIGLQPEQSLTVDYLQGIRPNYLQGIRPIWLNAYTVYESYTFKIGELEDEDFALPVESPDEGVIDFIYRWI